MRLVVSRGMVWNETMSSPTTMMVSWTPFLACLRPREGRDMMVGWGSWEGGRAVDVKRVSDAADRGRVKSLASS